MSRDEAEMTRHVARFRALPREELLRRIRDYEYFDMDLGRYGDPPRPGASLRSSGAVGELLAAVEAGVFDASSAAIVPFLSRLVVAERETGYRGRPMMMDFDFELEAMLRALRR